MAKRRLTGDYDGNEYLRSLRGEESYASLNDYTDEVDKHLSSLPKNMVGRKVDGNFYGHLKSGSVKSGKVKGSC